MIEILLIRHGETEYNKDGKFIGSIDIGLNDKGREQALRVSEKLKDENIDCVYSSDLKRCRETGESIQAANVVYTENLREMNFGHWDGLTYKEIKNKFPEEFKAWKDDWVNYSIPEGESFNDMSSRALKEFEQIITDQNDESKKIVIVSHGGCIRTILGRYIIGSLKDSWKFQIENGAISRMSVNNNYAFLNSLNEK